MGVKNNLLGVFFLFIFSVSFNASAESKLSGGDFKATIAAYKNFKIYIEKENSGDSDLEMHFKKIENYSIKIIEKRNDYLVIFTPKSIKGMRVFGDGAEYLINKKDYRVIKLKYYE